MSVDVVKQIPDLLSSPIVVTASNTNAGRVVVMGELYDENGKIVVVASELNPTSSSGKTTYTDVVKIATTQGRSHIQSLLKNVLYIDSNKKELNNG